MAYERTLDTGGEDDLLKQQLIRQMGAPQNTTQPVGAPAPLGPPSPLNAPPAGPPPPPVGAVGAAGGNTGVTGGAVPPGGLTSAPAPIPAQASMAGGAMARYGTADIEGAGDVKAGQYGGEGFSYESRAAAGDRGGNTIKNTFGKIASRYDPTQPGAAKAVMADPDFQKFFPEAKLIEHPNGDLIDFGDGKPVDVLRAAREGGAGEAWQWGVDDGSGPSSGGLGGGASVAGLMNGDALGGIQSEIDKLVNGQDSETQNLIQQILRGQGA